MVTDERIRQILREELNKQDVERIVSREIDSSYKSRDFKRAVKELTAQVIQDLYRTLWNRNSMWKGGVVK